MNFLKVAFAFLLNLPWMLLGILLALLSLPIKLRLHKKPFALIFTVRSFWWQTWLPMYKGVRACTLGNVMLLGSKLLPNDLEHELIHVEQCERVPLFHPFLYVYQTLRYGYKKNKYEAEAYSRAKNTYIEK
jgi:hypothetical protein